MSDSAHPGESSPGPRFWVVPHARNPGFVGRKPLLEQMERALRPRGERSVTVALSHAISGLGGVGKTQLAIEYVHTRATHYDAVLWVLAEPPSKLATDFADLARELRLPEATQTTDVNEQVRAVRRWLESPDSGRWLLVFDNADQPAALRDYLPTRHAGHVLITSRYAHWPASVESMEVQKLERPESIKLLLDRSAQADADAADKLADALGDLPLALAQAAGYLRESGLAIGTYLNLFQTRRAELLRRGDPPDDHQGTVFATLDLAMRRIDRPEAEELLGLVACLAPDVIPRTLLDRAFSDPLRLADALAALGAHSLIEADPQSVEVHGLVQAVAWDRMTTDDQARNAERAVILLEDVFPRESHEVRTWDACKALQPHADQAARLARECRMVSPTVGELLDRVGVFDEFRAQFGEAETRFHDALAVREAALGPNDVQVARSLVNLGRIHRKRNNLREARRCLQRALRINESSHGPDHSEVAVTLGDLGIVARLQGDLVEARQCLERALRIKELLYGSEHPQVVGTLDNLGIVARLQGDLAEARQCHVRTLRIVEPLYGPEHFRVAVTLGNLGVVARLQGNLAEARQCLERALRIFEPLYGPEHPEVATTLVNFGDSLVQNDEVGQARSVFERALDIFRRRLGDDHPDTIAVRQRLERITGKTA